MSRNAAKALPSGDATPHSRPRPRSRQSGGEGREANPEGPEGQWVLRTVGHHRRRPAAEFIGVGMQAK